MKPQPDRKPSTARDAGRSPHWTHSPTEPGTDAEDCRIAQKRYASLYENLEPFFQRNRQTPSAAPTGFESNHARIPYVRLIALLAIIAIIAALAANS